MTGLLTILILLGITIAIWQMVKIFDLAQANRDTSQVANDKDNSVNAYLMLRKSEQHLVRPILSSLLPSL